MMARFLAPVKREVSLAAHRSCFREMRKQSPSPASLQPSKLFSVRVQPSEPAKLIWTYARAVSGPGS